MTSRSFQYFMRRHEFEELLFRIAHTYDLNVILAQGTKPYQIEVSQQDHPFQLVDGTAVRRCYLSQTLPDLAALSGHAIRPNVLGWVVLDIPKEDDTVLFLSQIGAKSDWLDPTTSDIHENGESIQLFDRIIPTVRRQLHHPVWVTGLRGEAPRPARGVWYSAGATSWFQRGKALRQEGVGNVVFLLDEHDHPTKKPEP
jgi:hypothetical protein